MIPDYQSLMRPVLKQALHGEVRIGDVIETLGVELGLSDDELAELLPSGKQTVFANRVHWAKTYLKQAGLVRPTRRAHFIITDRGKSVLADAAVKLNTSYLRQFEEFQDFQTRTSDKSSNEVERGNSVLDDETPDEALRKAHKRIVDSLASDVLDRVREASPAFFEALIVDLLIAMGYGGTSEDAGRALGQSGDNGVDGVIDQDPLGVDQIYVQAKRYAAGNNIGAGAIRDFSGGLSLKRATKGIFVTTSAFTADAVSTARNLDKRIVLIDGAQIAKLMIRYNIGCRDEEILHVKKIDEDFFEG